MSSDDDYIPPREELFMRSVSEPSRNKSLSLNYEHHPFGEEDEVIDDYDRLLDGSDSPNSEEKEEYMSKLEVFTRRESLKSRKIEDKYDILDYDPYDDDLQVEEAVKLSRGYHKIQYHLVKWILFFIIGSLAGVGAVSILLSIDKLTEYKYLLVDVVIERTDRSFILSLLTLLGVNLALGSVPLIGVVLLGDELGGGGMSDVVAFLNGVKMPRVFRVKTLVFRFLFTILSVSAGYVVGPEAPIIQTGAIIGAGLSQGKASSFKFHIPLLDRLFQPYRNDREKLEAICAGAAAGMSAAFGAPIAGVLFVLEEAASFWNRYLIIRLFLASFAAKLVLTIFSSGFIIDLPFIFYQPGYLFFDDFNAPLKIFMVTPVTKPLYEPRHYVLLYHLFLFYLPLAILGGIMGTIYSNAVPLLSRFRTKFIHKIRIFRLFEGLLLLSLTTITIFVLCWFAGTCTDIAIDLSINAELKSLNCPEGQFNDLATLMLNGYDNAVKNLWHNPLAFSSSNLVIACFTLWFFLLLTNGIAIPYGLLVPSLVIGGAMGRGCAQIVNAFFSGLDISIHGAALVGSTAVLTGNTRLTLTMAAVVIETTNEFFFSLPFLFVIVLTKTVADIYSHSVVHSMIHLKHAPFLAWHPPASFRSHRAIDVMHSNLTTLQENCKVRDVIEVLRTDHHAFVVIGNRVPVLKGVISRSVLITLLRNRRFGYEQYTLPPLTLTDFRKYYPRMPGLRDIKLYDHDEDAKMDLRNYCNRWPYTVFPKTTLLQVFKLFRLMGLRHLIVVNQLLHPVGIITRKDLIHLSDHDKVEEKDVGVVYDPRKHDEGDFVTLYRSTALPAEQWREVSERRGM